MIINLAIECNNAAFEDSPGTEVARILRHFADRVENSSDLYDKWDAYPLHDINGNRVGRVDVKEN